MPSGRGIGRLSGVGTIKALLAGRPDIQMVTSTKVGRAAGYPRIKKMYQGRQDLPMEAGTMERVDTTGRKFLRNVSEFFRESYYRKLNIIGLSVMRPMVLLCTTFEVKSVKRNRKPESLSERHIFFILTL